MIVKSGLIAVLVSAVALGTSVHAQGQSRKKPAAKARPAAAAAVKPPISPYERWGITADDLRQSPAAAVLAKAGFPARMAAAQAQADQGDSVAQSLVALAYVQGYGAPKDYALARRYAELAAAQMESRSVHTMGLLYHNGWGVKRDRAAAKVWFDQELKLVGETAKSASAAAKAVGPSTRSGSGFMSTLSGALAVGPSGGGPGVAAAQPSTPATKDQAPPTPAGSPEILANHEIWLSPDQLSGFNAKAGEMVVLAAATCGTTVELSYQHPGFIRATTFTTETGASPAITATMPKNGGFNFAIKAQSEKDYGRPVHVVIGRNMTEPQARALQTTWIAQRCGDHRAAKLTADLIQKRWGAVALLPTRNWFEPETEHTYASVHTYRWVRPGEVMVAQKRAVNGSQVYNTAVWAWSSKHQRIVMVHKGVATPALPSMNKLSPIDAAGEQQFAAMKREQRNEKIYNFIGGVATFGMAAATAYSDLQARDLQTQTQTNAIFNQAQAQAAAIKAQREAAEATARASAAQAAEAQQAQGRAALSQRLAEANAYRERQIAQSKDPAERARLAEVSRKAIADTQRQLGPAAAAQVQAQTRAIVAGRQSGGALAQLPPPPAQDSAPMKLGPRPPKGAGNCDPGPCRKPVAPPPPIRLEKTDGGQGSSGATGAVSDPYPLMLSNDNCDKAIQPTLERTQQVIDMKGGGDWFRWNGRITQKGYVAVACFIHPHGREYFVVQGYATAGDAARAALELARRAKGERDSRYWATNAGAPYLVK